MPERQRMRNNGDIYTTLVERGNDGFVVIQDGLLKFANPRILEITGFSSEDVIGMPFINFIAASSRDKAARNYQKRMAGEAVPARYELDIMARDGRTIPVEMNASIITYEGRPADMAKSVTSPSAGWPSRSSGRTWSASACWPRTPRTSSFGTG